MGLLRLLPGTGSQADVVARLKALLPNGWFADTTPVLDSVLNGFAACWAGLFGLLTYVQAQSRIATATDSFLDLVASDFFGGALSRAPGEPDDSLRARILRNLLPPAATRAALAEVLTSLTNRPPAIFEPARLQDTGAYGIGATLAYGAAGGYGDLALPFQCFVHAYRPVGLGVANTNGYGGARGGYGAGTAQYTTPAMAASTIHDSDIMQSVAATMPVAAIAWLAISD